VYYNNTIIIATSNAGSAEIAELLRSGTTPDQLHKQTVQVLQKQFRPEFLNRFDAIVPFHQLQPSEISQIARLMLSDVIAKANAQKITVSFTDEAIQKIGRLGYDPAYGARPLRRYIQDKVEGLLAKAILEKSLQSGQSLEITADMIY
jgi:ATP-dependent Clp protease ATP-binding subunit ClpB